MKRGLSPSAASGSDCHSQEHDELDACSQKTPDWEKEVIMTLGRSVGLCPV